MAQEQAGLAVMATTIVAFIQKQYCTIGHVGDSRLSRLTAGRAPAA